MKIKKLKINGFGKLKDKDIELKEGINIIYGKNEAGKSTLLKFITGMFYGVSKNKNSKSENKIETDRTRILNNLPDELTRFL